MQVNYPVGDFLIQLKNAVMSGNRQVTVRNTKLIKSVAECLIRANLLSEAKLDNGMLIVKLAIAAKKPVIMDIKLVSSPGLRVYKSVEEIENMRGPEVGIFTTPKGVMFTKEALKARVGGEFIAKIT